MAFLEQIIRPGKMARVFNDNVNIYAYVFKLLSHIQRTKLQTKIWEYVKGHLKIIFLFSNFISLEYLNKMGSQGSSGSTVSGYGLHDRAIEVRTPAEAKGFFL
jgi:hypothetical protein